MKMCFTCPTSHLDRSRGFGVFVITIEQVISLLEFVLEKVNKGRLTVNGIQLLGRLGRVPVHCRFRVTLA